MFPTTPLWRLANRVLVTTYLSRNDNCFKTRVYLADDDAEEYIGRFNVGFSGVDFDHPIKKYSREYSTETEARKGHDEILGIIKDAGRTENG